MIDFLGKRLLIDFSIKLVGYVVMIKLVGYVVMISSIPVLSVWLFFHPEILRTP